MDFHNKKVNDLTFKEQWILHHEWISRKISVDLSITDFVYMSTICDPQRYGHLLQEKFINDAGLFSISATKNCGDAITKAHNTIEIKASVKKRGRYHLDRIRPFQNIEYYVFLFVDEFGEIMCFCVKSEVLFNENSEINLTAGNGTKLANSKNENVEIGSQLTNKHINYLKNHNLLKDTAWESLIYFWKNMESNPERNSSIPDSKVIDIPLQLKLSF